jgi:DNA-binding NarL/FixJ family response regulator
MHPAQPSRRSHPGSEAAMSDAAIRLAMFSGRRLMRDLMCTHLGSRPDFRVVGQAGTLDALLMLCRLRRPDAALVDAMELTMARAEALGRLHDAVAEVDLIVLYTSAAPAALEAAARGGITGLVPGSQGLTGVLTILRGRARPAVEARPDGSALSESDVRMLSLLGSGRRIPEIAGLLKVSARTVESHKRRICLKLGVENGSEAVSVASSIGLIDIAGIEPSAARPDNADPPAVTVGSPGHVLPSPRPVPVVLSARECDVLRSLAAGRSIKQTARLLGIAAKTVESTQARLYRKLSVRNRTEALTTAYRLGLLERPFDDAAFLMPSGADGPPTSARRSVQASTVEIRVGGGTGHGRPQGMAVAL